MLNVCFENFGKEVNSILPIVSVSFATQEGDVLNGYLIVDTGSSSNILFNRVQDLGIVEIVEDSSIITIVSSGSDNIESSIFKAEFTLGGIKYQEPFLMISSDIEEVVNEKYGNNNILGIIGSKFLIKHGLVLDFNCNLLYPSVLSKEEIDESENMFVVIRFNNEVFVPIAYLSSQDNRTMFPCLLDTGAEENITTKFVLNKLAYNYENRGVTSDMSFINENITTEECNITYKILGENKASDKYYIKSFNSNIMVFTDDREHIANEEEFLIAAILGCNAIKDMRMVIDFKNQFAYIKN